MPWSYRCHSKCHTHSIVFIHSAFPSPCSLSSSQHSTTISSLRLCSKPCRSLSLLLHPGCPHPPAPSYGVGGGLDSFSISVYRLIRSSCSDCSWAGEAPAVLGIKAVRMWDWNIHTICNVMVLSASAHSNPRRFPRRFPRPKREVAVSKRPTSPAPSPSHQPCYHFAASSKWRPAAVSAGTSARFAPRRPSIKMMQRRITAARI